MTRTPAFPTVTPPQPEKRPVFDTHHGVTRTDDYAWLSADNWQEMFSDPSLLDAQIRAHLEAENAYQAALMADTAQLRKQLFEEMKGRIKEDDFVRADEGWAVRLWVILQAWRRAAALFPHAARRRRRRDPARRRSSKPRARPISASAASTIRPTTQASVGLRRQGLRILHAARPRSRRRQRSGRTDPGYRRLGVWNAGNDGFFYTRLDRQPPPFEDALPSPLATDRCERPAGLRRNRSRLLHECRRHALQRLDH